jgi:lathosterol oxidase
VSEVLRNAGLILPWYGFALIGVAILALRYMIFAGGALALVNANQDRLAPRRLQPLPWSKEQLVREGAYSAFSLFILVAVVFGARMLNRVIPFLQMYSDFAAYGWLWFAISLPLAVLAHDFYFYWAHRFMHLPGVYEQVHKVHHLSTNPSPLAAFAFHPLEAVIEALGFVFMLAVVPLHWSAFLIVSTYMILTNVMGHLGYELFPRAFSDNRWLNWLNTATSHNQHHRTYRYNYGLYTLLWDKLFGTVHPHYEDTFERTTERQAA